MQDVGQHTGVGQQGAAADRLRGALLRQRHVHPAGELVQRVPGALAVAQQDQGGGHAGIVPQPGECTRRGCRGRAIHQPTPTGSRTVVGRFRAPLLVGSAGRLGRRRNGSCRRTGGPPPGDADHEPMTGSNGRAHRAGPPARSETAAGRPSRPSGRRRSRCPATGSVGCHRQVTAVRPTMTSTCATCPLQRSLLLLQGFEIRPRATASSDSMEMTSAMPSPGPAAPAPGRRWPSC